MLAEQKDGTFCSESLDTYTYEEIFHGETAQEISNVWANEGLAGCADCGFQAYCGADPIFNYATQGDMYGYRPTNGYCQKNMEIIRYLFERMNNDKQVADIFRSWISRKHYQL